MKDHPPAIRTLFLGLLGLETAAALFLIPAGEISLAGIMTMGGNLYKFLPFLIATAGIVALLEGHPLRWGRFSAPLTALVVVTFFATFGSNAPYSSIKQFLELLAYLGFYLVILNLPWKDPRVRLLMWAFLLGAFFLAGRAILGMAQGVPVRSSGLHGHPNMLGIQCILGILFILETEDIREGRGFRIAGYLAAGALGIVLMLTFSRTAFLGLFLCLSTLLVMQKDSRRRMVLGGSVVLLLLLGAYWETTRSRFRETWLDLEGNRPESRFSIWESTLRHGFPGMPLTGWAPSDGFELVVTDAMAREADPIPLPAPPHPHNQILDFLTRTGLPGLLVWIWFAVILFSPWNSRSKHNGAGKALPYAIAAALLPFILFEAVITNRNVFPMLLLLLAPLESLSRSPDTSIS